MSGHAGAPADLTLEGLVHDLNNVFQTVWEAADLLAADPNWAALAATIQRSVERGQRIAGCFQETAQASADLDSILDTAIAFTRDYLSLVHGPCLEFRREVEPGLRLKGLPGLWERVFVNLFLNSAHAVGSRGAVEIRALRAAAEAEITVSDDGPGIPESVLPHIFEPRFSTKASPGLGLHIVESIVTRHQGSIRAAAAPGRGASFSIRVPVYQS